MSELTEFRAAKDHFFGDDDNSPLTPEQKQDFNGLNYFEEDPDLNLLLDLQEFGEQEAVEIQTSTGDVARYRRWGNISFQANGRSAQLTVFKSDDGAAFLPFADATSGEETYGAGRYLEVEPPHNGKVRVDFNYAYNPYCAYNEKWSCPLTPPENRIDVSIQAGEKNFK